MVLNSDITTGEQFYFGVESQEQIHLIFCIIDRLVAVLLCHCLWCVLGTSTFFYYYVILHYKSGPNIYDLFCRC